MKSPLSFLIRSMSPALLRALVLAGASGGLDAPELTGAAREGTCFKERAAQTTCSILCQSSGLISKPRFILCAALPMNIYRLQMPNQQLHVPFCPKTSSAVRASLLTFCGIHPSQYAGGREVERGTKAQAQSSSQGRK